MDEDFNIEEPLFPFFPQEIKEFNKGIENDKNDGTEEIYREIKWDYENNKPVVENGNFVIAEGLEAVKSWVYRMLQIERYKYLIYSWDYGLDMEQFVGQTFNSLTKVEIIREITEGLLQNKYITSVDNFNITTEKKKVFVKFNINSKYGTIEDKKEVVI